MAHRCIIVSFMDADECYGAYVYTLENAWVASSHSLRLLAEACVTTAKAAIEDEKQTIETMPIEWHWLGLIADTSPAHVGALMAAYATPPSNQN